MLKDVFSKFGELADLRVSDVRVINPKGAGQLAGVTGRVRLAGTDADFFLADIPARPGRDAQGIYVFVRPDAPPLDRLAPDGIGGFDSVRAQLKDLGSTTTVLVFSLTGDRSSPA